MIVRNCESCADSRRERWTGPCYNCTHNEAEGVGAAPADNWRMAPKLEIAELKAEVDAKAKRIEELEAALAKSRERFEHQGELWANSIREMAADLKQERETVASLEAELSHGT